jgi:hypothetical protein
VVPFAEQTIRENGEMFPFGASIDTQCTVAMLAVDLRGQEQPASLDVLDELYQAAVQTADSLRAVAFVADVRVGQADALRVELEHRDGVTLTVLVPYSRSRFRKSITLGEMTVSAGAHRIFSP